MLSTGRQLPESGVSNMKNKGKTLIEMLIVIGIIELSEL
jgi:competence protein ComGC